MVKSWKIVEEKPLVSTRVFALEQHRAINPRNDHVQSFYVLKSEPWVNIIAITDQGKVLLVKQYRQGTQSVTLEIPGGTTDPEDQSVEQGAARELLEETGYKAGKIELIGVVDTNPAIQNNPTYTFLAQDLTKVADPELDPGEDLEVLEVDLAEVDTLIREKKITHSLVIAAFYWFEQHRDRHQKTKQILDDLAKGQLERVAKLARRINSRLTPDDLMSPQDFPELANDPDFNYQDGVLAGIEAVRAALRGMGY